MDAHEMIRRVAEVGVVVTPATKKHAREAARIMRAADALEVKCSGGFDPDKALRASINRSVEAYAAYAGGDLLCVFGLSKFDGGWAAPWALSTTHADRHRKAYWRASKVYVEYVSANNRKLVQMVHAQYSAALRWLKRLGFRVEDPILWGRANTLFCRVSMVAPEIEVVHV